MGGPPPMPGPGMYGRPPAGPGMAVGPSGGMGAPPPHLTGANSMAFASAMNAPSMDSQPHGINPGWAQRAQEIGNRGTEVSTTLYVGNIAPGVGDEWARKLLLACGPITSFKRAGAGAGTVKALVVKAQDKTRKFLDEFEKDRVVGDEERGATSTSAETIKAILEAMKDPNAIGGQEESINASVPSHLKDLPPEDLPEEHRGSVLSEIEQFRQASAARQEEKKRKERVMEQERRMAQAQSMREQTLLHPSNNWTSTAAGSPNNASGAGALGVGKDGPQSYQRPLGFVKSDDLDPIARDDQEEARRLEQQREATKREGLEAERRYVAAERRRFEHWERETEKERRANEDRVSRASGLLARTESWDVGREMEREMFFYDRSRWRSHRSAARSREEAADAAEEAAEAAEAAAKVEADRLAAEKAAADEAAALEAARAAGVLVPSGDGSHAPLRLKVQANAAGGTSKEGEDEHAAHAVANASSGLKPVLGEAEEEDLGRRRLRKIELGSTLSDSEKEALRAKHALRLEAELASQSSEVIWATTPNWDWVDEEVIKSRFRPLVERLMVEYVGEQVEELEDAVVSATRERAKPTKIIETLEPVLDDDAAAFVERYWRALLVDTLAAAASAADAAAGGSAVNGN
ncbi:U1 snRNP complex, subunit SNU71 and related PWI-motif proteins [Ceraceosorus bombacis]|uniref:U1 snRNP complex, subunit SNU71 and related PWI-motif proteins n=1 Tax=Ceraceosorus bombacis TaxID=401625 RepID=A0A0P1BFH3_9BASI|nr:U1 snRNP complex, subunit SNU71 and related PWI-motif proteins [Ceraceosorus bombacis]